MSHIAARGVLIAIAIAAILPTVGAAQPRGSANREALPAQAEHGQGIAEPAPAIEAQSNEKESDSTRSSERHTWPKTLEDAERASQEKCSSEEECRSEQRDYSDLRAQWKAADSAEDNVWWARFQTLIAGLATLVAGVGTYYLVGTFREAKRTADAAVTSANEAVRAALAAERANEIAASAAKDAAIATAEANRINREAMVTAQRAWLDIAEIKAEGPLYWANNVGHVWIRILIKNIGDHPAFNVGFSIVGKINFGVVRNPDEHVEVSSSNALAKSEIIGAKTIFPRATEEWSELAKLHIDRTEIVLSKYGVGLRGPAYITVTACTNYSIGIDSERRFTAIVRYMSDSRDAQHFLVEIGGEQTPADDLFFHPSIVRGTVAT